MIPDFIMIKKQEQGNEKKNRDGKQQEVKINDIRKGDDVVGKSAFIKKGGYAEKVKMPGNHGKGHDRSQAVKPIIVVTPVRYRILHIIPERRIFWNVPELKYCNEAFQGWTH